MSAHTPGPWVAVKYSAKKFGLGQRGDGAFFLLQCVNDTADDLQARADARLIAAAPDLLEALIQISENLPYSSPVNAHIIARAAIAKATGEQA